MNRSRGSSLRRSRAYSSGFDSLIDSQENLKRKRTSTFKGKLEQINESEKAISEDQASVEGTRQEIHSDKGSSFSLKHGDYLEEVDKQDNIRLQGRAKGLDALAEIASFPPLRTPHFNEDGDNRFRSKIQICVFGPSVLLILLIAILNIYPIFKDEIMDTTIQSEKIDAGFGLISN